MIKVYMRFAWLAIPLFLFQCAGDTYSQPELISGSIMVDNLKRTYLLTPPLNLTNTSPALVIVLHGGGGSAAQCERDYGWTAKAKSEQFMVVYPEGVSSDGPLKLRTWNAGRCCDYAVEKNINDVKFISVLIDQLYSQYHIDTKNVYVTGISNGGMLAYRLACELPEKIAAIGPVSGPLMTQQPCNPSRPVAIIHIHSELDTKVPYKGGPGILGYRFSSVDSTLVVWTGINQCKDSSPAITQKDQYTFYEWSTCGQSIQGYMTKDGGHSWPGGLKPRAKADTPSQAFNATDLIWNF